jgi:hypothetical protein
MNAAGVVADHAAQGAVCMGRRIRSKGEVEFFGRIPQIVEHKAGFDSRELFVCIQFDDAAHVLGRIQYDSNIAALSGKACSSAASKDRSLVPARDFDSLHNIMNIFWNHHANRDLPVIGGVSRVHCAAAGIEAYFAADNVTQIGCKPACIQLNGFRFLTRHIGSHPSA